MTAHPPWRLNIWLRSDACHFCSQCLVWTGHMALQGCWAVATHQLSPLELCHIQSKFSLGFWRLCSTSLQLSVLLLSCHLFPNHLYVIFSVSGSFLIPLYYLLNFHQCVWFFFFPVWICWWILSEYKPMFFSSRNTGKMCFMISSLHFPFFPLTYCLIQVFVVLWGENPWIFLVLNFSFDSRKCFHCLVHMHTFIWPSLQCVENNLHVVRPVHICHLVSLAFQFSESFYFEEIVEIRECVCHQQLILSFFFSF